MAIATGVDRACYGKALLGLEELRTPALANGWSGSDLHGRVARLLGPAPRSSSWPAVFLLSLAALAQTLTPYGKWMNEDVFHIIQPEERRAFSALRTDQERQHFIGQFWQRRDPSPGTEINEAREEHYRRIQWANQRCKVPGSEKPGWATEKGRTYIVFGPPDEIEVHPEQNNEQWFYKKIPGVGSNVTIEFGPRRVRR